MAHPQLEELLNGILPFAQKMLADHGSFFPYGSMITKEGEIVSLSATDGTEQPSPAKLIEDLTQAFRAKGQAGELLAAGLCHDVRIQVPGATEKSDAICVALEHATGEAINVFVPYKKGWLGRYKFGDVLAEAREPQFFTGDAR